MKVIKNIGALGVSKSVSCYRSPAYGSESDCSEYEEDCLNRFRGCGSILVERFDSSSTRDCTEDPAEASTTFAIHPVRKPCPFI